MKPRFFFYVLCLAAVFLISQLANAQSREPAPDSPAEGSWPKPMVIVDTEFRGKTAREWHRVAERYLNQLRRRWQPTVEYAYTLAAAVSGVPRWQLHAVGSCESHHFPFARNGRYLGVMQLGWLPFGLSPFDPIANVLSAALTVRHDGSWRQWECKP